ncbi:hypothetical protein A4H97_23450 [Niastella yeongjuensis]|uniref:Uncharacterized protein n=1 Tax=Niastella yeongjuensis TaxID=354355 RepID=A0A1V9F4W9_9BACT|nr:hypothetical protein [Niastella yeongjuensis]OQP53408.1 hypothetical protein A4H97_23450 [Niastella yeongjuensis]SEP13074.1 hypothetical protein SAMN05660816_04511 [Niastella yeongjuensis]
MKQLIIKIVKLSIIPVLVLLLIGVRQEQDRIVTYKRQLFEQNKGSVQCLVTGTSHTLNGINPTLMPIKTLNLAEEGKPIELDMEIIEQNLDQLPHLKYVIFPIDYFTFYFTGMREESAPKLYHHWNLKNGFIKSYKLKRFHALTCGFLLNEHNTNDQNDTIMGYRAEFADLSKADPDYRLHKYKRKLIDWNTYWIDTSSAGRIYKRFEAFITKLQQKQIQTILVTMPVCRQFYPYFDTNLVKKSNQLITDLLHNTKAKYINLQNAPSLSADSLFFDIDHLNDKGATIATAIIKDSILKVFSPGYRETQFASAGPHAPERPDNRKSAY